MLRWGWTAHQLGYPIGGKIERQNRLTDIKVKHAKHNNSEFLNLLVGKDDLCKVTPSG